MEAPGVRKRIEAFESLVKYESILILRVEAPAFKRGRACLQAARQEPLVIDAALAAGLFSDFPQNSEPRVVHLVMGIASENPAAKAATTPSSI